MRIPIMKHLNKPLISSLLLTFSFLAWKSPSLVNPTNSNNLDFSWQLALNWAEMLGLKFGKDVVFTFGPYYYFYSPLLSIQDQQVIFEHTIFYLIILTITIFIFNRQLINYIGNSFPHLILSITCFTFILLCSNFEIAAHMMLSAVVLVFVKNFYFNNWQSLNLKLLFEIVYCSFILALLPLVKFSFFISVISILIIQTIVLIVFYRQFKIALIYVLAFLLSAIILWILAGQPLQLFDEFIKYSWIIAKGYNEAMSINIEREHIYNYIIFIFLIGYCLVNLYLLLRKRYKPFISALLLFPIIFTIYKSCIVRNDFGHLLQSMYQLEALIPLFLILLFYWQTKINKKLFTVVLLFCLLIITMIPQNFEMLKPDFNMDPFNKKYTAPVQKSDEIDTHIIKEVDDSVDVIPWDIATLFVNDLNWKPRPAFQSYFTFTTELDLLNGNYYYSDQAPQYIIYQYKSIDDKYPLFDEPQVTKVLFSQYEVVAQREQAALFTQKDTPGQLNEKEISQGHAYFGDVVQIPPGSGNADLMFVYFDLELNLYGKLVNALYKLPPLYIEFNKTDIQPGASYRIVRDLGKDGFLVSCQVQNIQEAISLFDQQRCVSKVDNFSILGNMHYYQQPFNFIFTSGEVIGN